MRVAALYDIHGNLPALEAALAEVANEGVDLVVVGGDIVPGPMPAASVSALLDLAVPVAAAAERISATGYPLVASFDVQHPANEAEMLEVFEASALR